MGKDEFPRLLVLLCVRQEICDALAGIWGVELVRQQRTDGVGVEGTNRRLA